MGSRYRNVGGPGRAASRRRALAPPGRVATTGPGRLPLRRASNLDPRSTGMARAVSQFDIATAYPSPRRSSVTPLGRLVSNRGDVSGSRLKFDLNGQLDNGFQSSFQLGVELVLRLGPPHRHRNCVRL